jgi:hypothetical protein
VLPGRVAQGFSRFTPPKIPSLFVFSFSRRIEKLFKNIGLISVQQDGQNTKTEKY